MAQSQVNGLAALACYTVDSDTSDEDEDRTEAVAVKIEPEDSIITADDDPMESGMESETDINGPGTESRETSSGNPLESADINLYRFEPLNSPGEVQQLESGLGPSQAVLANIDIGIVNVNQIQVKEERKEVEEIEELDSERELRPDAPGFQQLQQVKVEIESDDESDSESDSSSDSSDEDDSEAKSKKQDEDLENLNQGPPKTQNELMTSDLPLVEDLAVTVQEHECQEIGTIKSIVESLVVVESIPGKPALDLDTVLFLELGKRALGRVFDVLGPVSQPWYAVRFNSAAHARERGALPGLAVFFSPKSELTSFVFLEQLMAMKISDASWANVMKRITDCHSLGLGWAA